MNYFLNICNLFDLMFDENYLEDRQINDVLLIGGGAFIIQNIF